MDVDHVKDTETRQLPRLKPNDIRDRDKEGISPTITYEPTEFSTYPDPMEEVTPHIRAGIICIAHQKKPRT